MERFLKRKLSLEFTSSLESDSRCSEQSRQEINIDDLPADPGLRTRIMEYPHNIRHEIRRAYFKRGPCQPRNHDFPQKKIGQSLRRFNRDWFDEYPTWLEYSIAKDAAFCLCYLFKGEIGEQAGGDVWSGEGYSNWKKKEQLKVHVGVVMSSHNRAWSKCQDLLNQKQHIHTIIAKQSEEAKSEYRARLNASIDCIRFLLRQGLAFRGHDESKDSSNQGNFLELLEFLANHNDTVKSVVLANAPENLKLTSPDIQKDIVNATAIETTSAIIKELGDAPFSILIDESRDVSIKKQMAIALRYVDKCGHIIERILGIKHVTSTSAILLKSAVEELLCKHGLSMSRLRGQGYDGASNMQGEFNGLKTLIMQENESAYYIHCFAHQLQLALVAVAKNCIPIASLFLMITTVVNVVGGSCKRRDMLQEKHATAVIKALDNDELQSGRGLNQEIIIKRASDTRWGSHYSTLISLIGMFPSVIDVLEKIVEDGSTSEQKAQASNLLDSMQSFENIFNLYLMSNILGITNELSQALQRKDQDIINAMRLVQVAKQRLRTMREDDGWSSFIEEVSSFCEKYDIQVPNMNDKFLPRGRPRRLVHEITYFHHYKHELFNEVIDKQLMELDDRFNETNTELLLCVACLDPSNLFSSFDKQKLVRLAQLYPKDFSQVEHMALSNQLETYIIDLRSSEDFAELKGISDLAQKLVDSRRDKVYPLIYKLLTLALLLPIATATVERAFSAMKIVKNRLRNRMGDQWVNDSLIVYIEKDIFDDIDNEAIMQRFQSMKTRRGQL